jgi:hypothetical protein
VTDNAGIHLVEFVRWDAVNSQLIELTTVSSAPYQASVDVNTLNMKWNEILARVMDTAGNLAVESIFIYRLNPTISLDITEGSRGTALTATGSGWLPGDTIIISLGDSANIVTKANVDTEGNFIAAFTVPANAVIGEQKVIAITANGSWQAEASFTVAEPDETPSASNYFVWGNCLFSVAETELFYHVRYSGGR